MTTYSFGYDFGTSEGTAGGATVWQGWVDAGTSTTASNTVWATWTGGSSVTSYTVPVPTDQQAAGLRAAALARQEQITREVREAQERRKQADQLAQALLESMLSPEQRRTMDEIGSFLVMGENQRMYRIRKGMSGNIDELDDTGKPVARLCIVSKETIPQSDQMLAQKLMIEANHREFTRLAVRTPIQ